VIQQKNETSAPRGRGVPLIVGGVVREARRAAIIIALSKAMGTEKFGRSRLSGADEKILTLWKDADPEIPILKQAKTEYARLH